jgi:hypothetical protein
MQYCADALGGQTRETMVALLAVETGPNGDLCRAKGRGPTLVRYFFPALVALASLVKNNIFVTVLNLCVPLAQQAGQAVVQGSLVSEYVSPGQRHILRDR